MLLLELVDLVANLIQRSNLIQGQAHDTALLGNSLEDGLANPPHGIGDELETACLIKLLGSLDEADVTLVDEVGERQTLMLVLLGHGNDETQIGCHKLVLGTFALWATLSDFLCQFYFLINTD